MAALLDDAATFPDLSVGEHLELLARGFGVADPAAAVAAVLADVGLGGRAEQLPATLSSGQRHRLGLASVLVRPAGLLLLDEPEQRLDEAGGQWLAGRLRSSRTPVLGGAREPRPGAHRRGGRPRARAAEAAWR